LNNLLKETISFNDAYENFYHGFVVGVLANMHEHVVKSSSIFEPAVIIELKVCDNPKEIFKKCDEALKQIEEKKYDSELIEEGYENIIKYGISFYRKDCIVKI
jgi:hypothetical protein